MIPWKALVVAVSLIPVQVSAAELTGESLDKLMLLSGLNKQMAEIPGMVLAGFEQAMGQGSPARDAELEEVRRTIREAFQPSDILGSIGVELKKRVSEADAREMFQWYESGLGRKITKAEELASTPAAFEEMVKDAPSLLGSQQRVLLAQQIDRLMNITDMMVEMQEHTGVAVFTAIEKAKNPDLPVQLSSFKAQMASLEPQMRANAEQLVTVSLVYSYRSVDVGEVEKYIKFLGQPTTQRFNDVAMSGMKDALKQCTDAMARSLAVALRKHHGDGE